MRRTRTLTLIAVLLAAVLALGGCEYLGPSEPDPSSPPEDKVDRETAVEARCFDGTLLGEPAGDLTLKLHTGYQQAAFVTLGSGNDRGFAPPRLLRYEKAFFAPDAPRWSVLVEVKQQCVTPDVSPYPDYCVTKQTVKADVVWASRSGYPEHLLAKAILDCSM